MSKSIEILIILVIVGFQFGVANWTYRQIVQIKNFLKNIKSLRLVKYHIPVDRMEGIQVQDIISERSFIDSGEENEDEAKVHDNNVVRVSLIQVANSEKSALLRKVIYTINSYLLRNKGAVSDFNLIKDIVERQCDTIDEEINRKLPVPLYLGLMGTVLGIIVGLLFLKFDVTFAGDAANESQAFMTSIGGLINGVKLAMICSFFGLLLTTILSAWFYRHAKTMLENQKNDLYTFIQIELLPQLNQSTTSSILNLQANLQKFNESFEKNIYSFGGIMDSILSSMDGQTELITKLEKMDVAQLARVNVNVLKELNMSMKEFEKFNKYLSQMNEFVLQTSKLTNAVDDQLKRTDEVSTVVHALSENVQRNQTVMEMLRKFLERIDEKRAVITASADLDSAMKKAIDELRAHIEQEIGSIKDYTIKATSELENWLGSDKSSLVKLSKLDQLDNLSKLSSLDSLGKVNDLVTAVYKMKEEFEHQNFFLMQQITALASFEKPKHEIPILYRRIAYSLVCIASLFIIVLGTMMLTGSSFFKKYVGSEEYVYSMPNSTMPASSTQDNAIRDTSASTVSSDTVRTVPIPQKSR